MFTSQRTATTTDDDLQFLSDGIVELRYDDDERRIVVPKFRGSDKRSGTHGVTIEGDGLHVYPQLLPGESDEALGHGAIASGVDEIDDLLGGGIERGTISVVSGPTGVGKTTTGTQFTHAAASRDERSVVFLFEESAATFRHRSEAVGIPVGEMEAAGSLEIVEVEPLTTGAEAFAEMVRREVETHGAELVLIDGIQGYKLSLHGTDDHLVRKLHSLGRYLKNRGVTTILVDEIDTVTGDFRATDSGISYLADNVVFLRHLEVDGELRKAIGVLKKRVGTFERTLREFEITGEGIVVGEPLTGLRGVLQGKPEWVGDGPRE